MVMAMTKDEIQRLAGDTDAMIREIQGWEDAELFHKQIIPAGALPLEIQFFNAVKAYGITNMDKANEVIYPTIIGEIGVDIRGVDPNALSDCMIFLQNAELALVKDNREYATWPLAALPSGGGLQMAWADAAVHHEVATNGVDARMHGLYAAISFMPQQTLRVIIRTTGAVIAGNLNVKPLLRGLQARNPV